jgi:hypothetical protein
MFQPYMQVVLYRPNSGLGCAVGDSPPGIPEEGADAIYSFESLPAKQWKKYVYASRYRDHVVYRSEKALSTLLLIINGPSFI